MDDATRRQINKKISKRIMSLEKSNYKTKKYKQVDMVAKIKEIVKEEVK